MTLTSAQIKERRHRIGGSEVAAVLGVDPHNQPLDVYNRIVEGIAPDLSDNERVFMGSNREDAIAREYARKTGYRVRKAPAAVNKSYPWLVANVDRLVERAKPKRGVEIKNVHWTMGQEWSDGPPAHYEIQARTYQVVKDYPLWDITASIGGDWPKIYTVENDREWSDLIVEVTRKFWVDHIMRQEPPPFDYEHARARETLKTMYPGVDPNAVVQLDDLAIEIADELALLKGVAKMTKEQIATEEAKLRYAMGSANFALLPDGRVFRRAEITRKAYSVAESTYIDFRPLKKLPKGVKP